MARNTLEQIERSWQRAKTRRAQWEPLWRDCYTFAQPHRGAGLGNSFAPASRHAERVFDATAADAVEQLAASLLAELAPPWSRWFGLRPGPAVPPAERGAVAEALEEITVSIHAHLDRSSFAVELHQCFLDLATGGTATMLFEEAPAGAPSAFSFAALPVAEVFVDGDQDGKIVRHFRVTMQTVESLRQRFPERALPPSLLRTAREDHDRTIELVEAVEPCAGGVSYCAFLPRQVEEPMPTPLAEGRFDTSPFVTFRWLKGTGEVYGRSPVMTSLPDIKTANKVVELILRNASIAVTGIWLADDDGVLNPANIRLVPGSIIPKAVGSAGLTPLQAPGRFDVSQLVLDDLRARIRHTLLTDRLGPVAGPRMTATEVLQRSAETTRILGAMFGRLQAELLVPLLKRAIGILRRRGDIPDIVLDGNSIAIEYRSPLARGQAREDVSDTLMWLETVQKLGDDALEVVDARATARWLARRLGVPDELVIDIDRPAFDLIPPGGARRDA